MATLEDPALLMPLLMHTCSCYTLSCRHRTVVKNLRVLLRLLCLLGLSQLCDRPFHR